jgi:hypothetical protein
MRTAKEYSEVTKLTLRCEIRYCPFCQRYLRRTCTLNQRTIVTLHQAVFLVHCGYRCPDEGCSGHSILYRNAAADALALPGFTFGLDVLVLAGTLRLLEHRTRNEVHWALLDRLGSLGVSISEREVGYLIETYIALLQAGSSVAEDEEWQEQMRAQGGMILSIDGIQPDQGNTTVYLVREVESGRIILAEPVRNSETETLKRLLAPIQALPVPVRGIVSDAQASLVCAIAALWSQVPHQICQFHALRDASKLIVEEDGAAKRAVCGKLQPKLREYRSDLAKRKVSVSQAQRVQYDVLDRYAACAQAALHQGNLAPFRLGGLQMQQALDALEASLSRIKEKGALPVTQENNDFRD